MALVIGAHLPTPSRSFARQDSSGKVGDSMEWYRLTLTVSDHGRSPENGEIMLGAFATTHPEVGPVVSQNTETGSLTVTIAVAAADASEAVKEAIPIFLEGLVKSGLAPANTLEISAGPITSEEQEDVRELEIA